MPKLKTKDLAPTSPDTTSGTLDHVEIMPNGPATDKEKLWHLIGRHEALMLTAGFATATWAANLARIKDSKLYLQQEKDWDTWCHKRTPFSYKTADRMIADWREFGKWGFVAREILHLSREGLRALNPSITGDGEIEIGGEKYSLKNKDSICAAQLAIEAMEDEKKRANQSLYDAERAKKKLTEERDNAKKAVEKTRKDFAEYRDNVEHQAERAWEHADDDQRFLIKLEMDRNLLLERLRSFADCRELSQANQDRLVAFCEAMWAEVHQLCEKVRGHYGIGLLRPNPASTVEVDELTPNKRSLIEEYEAEHPLK